MQTRTVHGALKALAFMGILGLGAHMVGGDALADTPDPLRVEGVATRIPRLLPRPRPAPGRCP